MTDITTITQVRHGYRHRDNPDSGTRLRRHKKTIKREHLRSLTSAGKPALQSIYTTPKK